MYYRDKSSFCAEHFCEDLNNNLNKLFSAQPALNIENFNKLFNQFAHIILSTINTHPPLKSLPRKENKLKFKPLITKSIFTSIKKKNNMFKSHFINGNQSKKTYFKKYSNKTKIKVMSKQLYYSTKPQESQNDPRGMWKIICSALPTYSDRSINNNSTSNIHGKKITDSPLIANHFHEFFL